MNNSAISAVGDEYATKSTFPNDKQCNAAFIGLESRFILVNDSSLIYDSISPLFNVTACES